MTFTRRALTLAALAWSGAMSAQEAPKPVEGPEVVVTARRETEAEVREFVGALTQASGSLGQLSRFETRQACPATVGVSPGQSKTVVARMRRVAASAGVPVAKPGCVPNILVIVTADKKAFINALSRKHPYYLGGLSDREVRRLINDPAPAAAWQLAGPQVSGDGNEIQSLDDDPYPVNDTTRAATRVSPSARPQFVAAVVVVEARALDGLTPTQLADYATMRAFARTDPAKLANSTAPTILKILDAPMGSEIPITLTPWDLGFLKALYAAPGDAYAPTQRSAMRKALSKELAGERPKSD